MADTKKRGQGDFRREPKPDTSSMILSRVPPQNVDAEKSVLGAMLLDKDAILMAEDKLTPEDFYREADAVIFKAILNLSHRGEPADILTVTEELKRMGRLDDVGGVHSVSGEKLGRSSALAELVTSVDIFNRLRGCGGEHSGDQFAKASGHVVLLGDNHGSGLDGGGDDCLGVKWLDGRHIDNLGADSLCLKSFGCLKGLPNHVACREEGDVLALVQHVCLSDLERLVWCEVGNLRTAETQIDRTIVFGRGDRRVLCLCPVARVDHNHFRKGTHQGDVLHCLVGGAVLAEGDSGV